ncbi:MAG: arabinogalactan oligomer / maltooligosaccharide transport system substrate-binding protein [Gaiellaceae bacterium]|jgi:arabinogalactan oligomer/maltooligosaccharide transport system substrate-binding protein|nr:arabinogalactan oligomer / maltooligosaccharide transport system substrate-binding protein [Gaiellaceae bacterium]MDX6493129.1 arabinogalactan oligomer / maltooligosaccharide transport system substrate-binding protein [Gaiellaceae bacterium]MDX6518408.1 arabinogalactan oligomer / maltooligosaccharide transport system substrate-binding protein [Gaiellaceae bacterium]
MKRRIALGGLVVAVLVSLAAMAALSSAQASLKSEASPNAAAATTIVVWTDQNRKADVDKVTSTWGATRGVDVKVVVKDFGQIRDALKTIAVADAPDVIVGAHDWTGELAANGLVLPLFPRAAVKKQFPKYSLNAFSYGKNGARLYGIPTQLENIALIVNTGMAHAPKNWKDLESQALKIKKRTGSAVGIAVQQGSGGDAYHMYPFFSGLCGYVFQTTKTGGLNPSNIGVANKKFLANSALIDKWNSEGLIRSSVDSSTAQDLFLKQKTAFWVTGPWNVDPVRKAGIKFKIVQIPAIKCKSVPFLGVQGFMVTKYSTAHGVESAAKDLVSNYMAQPAAQVSLALANSRFPANTVAGKRVHDSALSAFGKASLGGVPMPNIPEMNSVWGDLGSAWVKSTKGPGATKARVAFSTAAKNIRIKIAGG